MTPDQLTDDELLRQFESASLAAEDFGHRQHVRVAWLFVTRHPMPGAIAAFDEALRRFAAARGAHGLYHATITWAYLLLVHERQMRCPFDSWTSFAAANPDLLTWKPSVLDQYYSPDVLWSEFAKRTFVMPNRGQLRA